MKQAILTFVTICIAFIGNICIGQVTRNGDQFNVSGANILSGTYPPSSAATASASASTHSRIIWLEYGDGGFTSDANSNRILKGTSSIPLTNTPLLVSTRLYDTTRDYLRISSQTAFSPTGGVRLNSDNDQNLLSPNTNVYITPNTYDIISRDTMCFALSYKLNMIPIGSTAGKSFYLVFRYNTNTFKELADWNATPVNFVLNSQNVPEIRSYHSETRIAPFSNLSLVLPSLINPGTNKVLIVKINPVKLSMADNNFFLSLVTKDDLGIGNATSIDANIVQYDSTLETEGLSLVPSSTYTISGMTVRVAHDPNYIMQSPVCMQLPKTVREMTYHVHFQNTGRGSADIVRVTANLPMGLNFTTFDLKKAVFSGSNYTINSAHNQISIVPDQAANKIVFMLNKTAMENTLQGTDEVQNPAVSAETMGDIYFTIKATVNVPYTLVAQAFIDFHSSSRPVGIWENTVATNIAVSNYSACCDCVLFDCDANKNTPKSKLIKTAVKK